jgi:hypothetical protein
MLSKIKKYVAIATLVFAVVVVLYLIFEHKTSKELKAAQQEYVQLVAKYGTDRQAWQDGMAAKDKAIAEANAQIEAREKETEKSRAKERVYLTKIGDLEKERNALTDKDAIIANLDKQIAAWKDAYYQAQQTIALKDATIAQWAEKYKLKDEQLQETLKQLTYSENLRGIADEMVSRQAKEIKKLNLTNNIKKGLLIAAVAIVILK